MVYLISEEHAIYQKTQFDSIRLNNRYLNAMRDYSELFYGQDSGAVVPDFVLQKPNGDEFNLHNLKGKIVYIDFWATWC